MLFLVAGLPILVPTAAITVGLESSSLLVLTLPGVLFPILVWFGLGNIVSVVLAVAGESLRQRWSDRHDGRRTADGSPRLRSRTGSASSSTRSVTCRWPR